MTAVINLGGIDKIVLIRVGHGFLKIENVQELRKTNKFYNGELPLNGKIHWEDEIRLNVDYMSGTEIIIRKNGVDK